MQSFVPLQSGEDTRYEVRIDTSATRPLAAHLDAGLSLSVLLRRTRLDGQPEVLIRDRHRTRAAATLGVRLPHRFKAQVDLGYTLGVSANVGSSIALHATEKGPFGRLSLSGKPHSCWFVTGTARVTRAQGFDGDTKNVWVGILSQSLRLNQRFSLYAKGEYVSIRSYRQVGIQGGVRAKLWPAVSISALLERAATRSDADHSAVLGLHFSL